MLDLNTLQLFLSAAILLAFSPGPDNLYVVSQSAIHGRLAGLLILLGLCTGLIFHTALVAIGLAAIIASTPWLLTAFKLIGAGYLCFLAWQCFHSKVVALETPNQLSPPTHRFFIRGVVMNISNPKVALFFLAFLPPFIDDAQSNIAWQAIQLGGLFILVTLLVFSLFIVMAEPIRYWLATLPSRQIILNRLTGGVLVALACYIAFLSVSPY